MDITQIINASGEVRRGINGVLSSWDSIVMEYDGWRETAGAAVGAVQQAHGMVIDAARAFNPTPPNSPRLISQGSSNKRMRSNSDVGSGRRGSSFAKLSNSSVNRKSHSVKRMKKTIRRRKRKSSKIIRGRKTALVKRAPRRRKAIKRKRVARRRSRKKSKKTINYAKGIHSHLEHNARAKDLQVVFVGHATVAASLNSLDVARAVVKTLWKKEGFTVDDNLYVGPPVAAVIAIRYYSGPTAATALNVTAAIPASSTFGATVTLVNNLLLRTFAAADDDKYQYSRLTYRTDPETALAYRFNHTMLITECMLHIKTSTMLSMQNTTENTANTSSTDTNSSVPLEVTKYYGPGNGTYMLNRGDATGTITGFIGNQNDGSISVISKQYNNLVISEPPKPAAFHRTKGGKKTILPPGAILRNKMNSSMSISLANWFKMHHTVEGGATPPLAGDQNFMVTRGKFAMFAFDKVVNINKDAIGTPSDITIDIDYQVDYKSHIVFTAKNYEPALPFNAFTTASDMV